MQAEHGFAADGDLKHQTDMLVDKRKLFNIGEYEDILPTTTQRRRGRKNRFFKQIDNEDNDAGALLDSDDEGNSNARRAIDAEFKKKRQLATIREAEEKETKGKSLEQKR